MRNIKENINNILIFLFVGLFLVALSVFIVNNNTYFHLSKVSAQTNVPSSSAMPYVAFVTLNQDFHASPPIVTNNTTVIFYLVACSLSGNYSVFFESPFNPTVTKEVGSNKCLITSWLYDPNNSRWLLVSDITINNNLIS